MNSSAEYNDDVNNTETETKMETETEMETKMETEITTLDDSKLIIPTIQYSSGQEYAFRMYKAGYNIAVLSSGGTGKSFLIKRIYNDLLLQYKLNEFAICALTGCASLLLDCKARTIHSWSGLKVARGDFDQILKKVLHNNIALANWKSCKVLIVDEVSMMSQYMFDLLNKLAKYIRRNDRPFGNIQVLFFGDFFQLPPIGDPFIETSGKFCFESPEWEEVFPKSQTIQLTQYFRQKDPVFTNILHYVRWGIFNDDCINALTEHTNNPTVIETFKKLDIKPVRIFPTKAKANEVNNNEFNKLEGDIICFKPIKRTDCKVYIDSGLPIEPEIIEFCCKLNDKDIEREIANLVSILPMEEEIQLKRGAVVMLSYNLDVERGLVNGSQGILYDFEERLFDFVLKGENDGSKKEQIKCAYPVVKFYNGLIEVIPFVVFQNHQYPTIVIKHIPLRLAWALTIHKMQGTTLEYAEIDIGKEIFEVGQTYVALSRLKSMDGLLIKNFVKTKIQAHPLVRKFYMSLPVIDFCEKLKENIVPFDRRISLQFSNSTASQLKAKSHYQTKNKKKEEINDAKFMFF